MTEGNSANREAVAAASKAERAERAGRGRARATMLLADILLDVIDALCSPEAEYAELRDGVLPLLEEVARGRRR